MGADRIATNHLAEVFENHIFAEAFKPSRDGKLKLNDALKPTGIPSEDTDEEDLRQVAEQVAESALSPEDPAFRLANLTIADEIGGSGGVLNSPTRPEWQKLCIQYSVCIHNIYGNCAYGTNCYYHHLDDFKKPDLLFKTEMCRYGIDCVNRSRCCFAHSKMEKRTPEQNVREALAKNHVLSFPAAVFPTQPNMPPAPQPPRPPSAGRKGMDQISVTHHQYHQGYSSGKVSPVDMHQMMMLHRMSPSPEPM